MATRGLPRSSSVLIASFTPDRSANKAQLTGLAAMGSNIAVADNYNRKVLIFTHRGIVANTVGEKKLRGPGGVAACQQQWIVSDCGLDKHRIVIYSEDGHYKREFQSADIKEPGFVTCNFSGQFIAVIDQNSPKICIFTNQGDKHSEINPTLTQKDTRFLEFTTYELPDPTDFISPESCAFDSEDRLYVTFGSAASMVQVYNIEGEYLHEFGEWNSPCGIHVTSRGNVLVADRELKTVDVWTTKGEKVRSAVLSPAKGLNLYPHHLILIEGNVIAVTVASDMFGSPDTVQLFQL